MPNRGLTGRDVIACLMGALFASTIWFLARSEQLVVPAVVALFALIFCAVAWIVAVRAGHDAHKELGRLVSEHREELAHLREDAARQVERVKSEAEARFGERQRAAWPPERTLASFRLVPRDAWAAVKDFKGWSLHVKLYPVLASPNPVEVYFRRVIFSLAAGLELGSSDAGTSTLLGAGAGDDQELVLALGREAVDKIRELSSGGVPVWLSVRLEGSLHERGPSQTPPIEWDKTIAVQARVA